MRQRLTAVLLRRVERNELSYVSFELNHITGVYGMESHKDFCSIYFSMQKSCSHEVGTALQTYVRTTSSL